MPVIVNKAENADSLAIVSLFLADPNLSYLGSAARLLMLLLIVECVDNYGRACVSINTLVTVCGFDERVDVTDALLELAQWNFLEMKTCGEEVGVDLICGYTEAAP